MHLYDYINEICEVSSKNGGDMNTAIDMFMNNVDDAGRADDQHVYEGPENFDYSALKPFAAQFRKDEMGPMKSVVKLHDTELMKLHKAGEYDAAIAKAEEYYNEIVSHSEEAEGVDK